MQGMLVTVLVPTTMEGGAPPPPPQLLEEQGSDSITFKELLLIVMAVAVWGPQWQEGSVIVQCDNQGAVAAVNLGYSKALMIITYLLQCLFFIKAHFRVEVSASYLPGHLNMTADAISRDNLPFLFSQVPAARWSRIPLPGPLIRISLDNRLDWTCSSWRASFAACFPPP